MPVIDPAPQIPVATPVPVPASGTMTAAAAFFEQGIGTAMNAAAPGMLFGMILAQLGQGHDSEPAADAAKVKVPDAEDTSLVVGMLQLISSPIQANASAPEVAGSMSTSATADTAQLEAVVAVNARPVTLEMPLIEKGTPQTVKAGIKEGAGDHTMALDLVADIGREHFVGQTTPAPNDRPILQNSDKQAIASVMPRINFAPEANKPSVKDDKLAAPVLPVQPNIEWPESKIDQTTPAPLLLTSAEVAVLRKREDTAEIGIGSPDDAFAHVMDRLASETAKMVAHLNEASPPAPVAPVAAAAKALPVMPDVLPATPIPSNTLHIQLEPPELGKITLQVSVQAQQVQATVAVEHRGLGEFLVASQGALDDAMRQHGLRIDELHIETYMSDFSFASNHGGILDHGNPREHTPTFQGQGVPTGIEGAAPIVKHEEKDSGPSQRISVFA